MGGLDDEKMDASPSGRPGRCLAGGLFVGLLGSGEAGVDLTVGLLLFLCILVTVCTGLILSKLDALKKQLGQRDPVGDASDQGQELAREE